MRDSAFISKWERIHQKGFSHYCFTYAVIPIIIVIIAYVCLFLFYGRENPVNFKDSMIYMALGTTVLISIKLYEWHSSEKRYARLTNTNSKQ